MFILQIFTHVLLSCGSVADRRVLAKKDNNMRSHDKHIINLIMPALFA